MLVNMYQAEGLRLTRVEALCWFNMIEKESFFNGGDKQVAQKYQG